MSNKNKLYHLVLAGAATVALGAVLASCTEKPEPPRDVTLTVLERVPKGAQPANKAPAKPTVAAGSPEDLARHYQVPVTSTQPQQGPEDALVTMVTWCDFRSQTCRDAEQIFKAAMKKYQGKLRWAWRHNPTEAGDMTAHLLAQAVFDADKTKFWQFRDLLLAAPGGQPLSKEKLAEIVGTTGLSAEKLLGNAPAVGAHVDADRRFADQFGVIRPLGVFVNGKRLALKPVAELQPALQALINEEIEHATRLVKSGVPKARLYNTMTDDGYWGIADDPEKRLAAIAKAKVENRPLPKMIGLQAEALMADKSAAEADKPTRKDAKQPKTKAAASPGARDTK